MKYEIISFTRNCADFVAFSSQMEEMKLCSETKEDRVEEEGQFAARRKLCDKISEPCDEASYGSEIIF